MRIQIFGIQIEVEARRTRKWRFEAGGERGGKTGTSASIMGIDIGENDDAWLAELPNCGGLMTPSEEELRKSIGPKYPGEPGYKAATPFVKPGDDEGGPWGVVEVPKAPGIPPFDAELKDESSPPRDFRKVPGEVHGGRLIFVDVKDDGELELNHPGCIVCETLVKTLGEQLE